eukprot:TRINITY_DN66844_c10_g1_i1.p2 TRINITY_DN66844_c10_g1~~TRINITY_DN66844_c10_g1_i1.p2  ORF type:complete len:155 (+),score=5.11 TRINITY_DN66844_c10_g1_i1:73-537(+)
MAMITYSGGPNRQGGPQFGATTFQQQQPYYPTGYSIPGVTTAPNDGLAHPAYRNTTKFCAPTMAPIQMPYSISPEGYYQNQWAEGLSSNQKDFFTPRHNSAPMLYRPYEKPIYRDGQPVTNMNNFQPRRQYEKPRHHWNQGGVAQYGGQGTMYF